MDETWRRRLKWLAGSLTGGLVLLFLAAALSLDSRWLGLILIHHIAAKIERKVRVDGSLQMRFWSLTPRLTADNVTIENPPWAHPGTMAHIGRVTLLFRWPHLMHRFDLQAIELSSATLHLWRDATGRSNWQLGPPGTPPTQPPPIIHGLSIPDAEVQLDDQDLHLQFAGKVSAGDASGLRGEQPLSIVGTGRLNGRPVRFTIESGPLAAVRSRVPYHFQFEETSSGSHLEAHGFLPRPFDFLQVDATFEAQGQDLKDLYFLTGVSLTDTGRYHLSGDLQRRGTLLALRNLAGDSGRSDMSGTVLVHSLAGGAVFVEMDLDSKLVQLKDLGEQASGHASPPATQARLLIPDTSFGLRRFRRSNARVRFRAQDFVIGRMDLRAVTAGIAFEHGEILAKPVSATLAGGKLTGELRVDLTHELPEMALDLRASDVELGELLHRSAATEPTSDGTVQPVGSAKAPPALEGPLDARLTLTGRGDSLHQLAATAEGRTTAVLPHGSIRASIAELAGLDFARWLGVLLGTRQKEATVRCGIASFGARNGTLGVERLMIDTGPALIAGSGDINLDSEALDLTLRDKPTHLRLLHKQVPVQVGGTLKHPSLNVGAVAKVGAKAALGAVLAPIEAIVHFINPQLTQNADCAAVLADFKRNDVASAPAGTASSPAGQIQRR
jgi:AsmA family protein